MPDNWAKRMESFEAEQAPIRVQYRYRPQALPYEVIYKQGNNREQEKVTIVDGEPASIPWLKQ